MGFLLLIATPRSPDGIFLPLVGLARHDDQLVTHGVVDREGSVVS